MHARAVTCIVLAACGSTAHPAPTAPTDDATPAPSTKAVAEPHRPAPRPEARRGPAMRLDEVEARPLPAVRPELAQKRSDLWDPCVRDLVQTRRADIRDELGDALTQAMTTCIRETQTVTFEPPRSGRAYAMGSHVGIAGVLTPSTTELVLRVVTRGFVPERLTILAGGARWTSPPLEVTHDGVWGRELASIPYTKTVARAVRRMLDTDGALLRFESASGIEDVPLTEELALDLRAMIDVVDEL